METEASSVPWLSSLKQEIDAEQSKKELASQQRLHAEYVVKRDGPEFYNAFVRELAINTGELKTLGHGWTGRTVTVSDDSKPECQCNVTVEHRGPITQSTWVKILYSRGSGAIVVLQADLGTRLGRPTELTFCLCGNGYLGVVGDDLPPGSNAREAAELVVQRMVAIVRD
jgi:hypothetical protein